MATKQDLIAATAERCNGDITKATIDEVLQAAMASIIDIVVSGEKLTLRGFGTFTSQPVSARAAVNPTTGDRIEVPAKVIPRFWPSIPFKDAVADSAITTE